MHANTKQLFSCATMLGAALLFVAPAMDVRASDVIGEPGTAAAPTEVLFMGANLTMESGRKYHPVYDVTPISVTIHAGERNVSIPLARSNSLLVRDVLKLTSHSVTVEGLSAEPVYGEGSDPLDQLTASSALASGESAVQDLARVPIFAATVDVNSAQASLSAVRGTPLEADAQAELQSARARLQGVESGVIDRLNAPGSQLADVGARASTSMSGGYDALRVIFRVTADRDIELPYCAVIADIKDPDGKGSNIRRLACLKAFGPLRAGKSFRVVVYQGGLPPGFKLEGCVVHLYEGREELATNLSRRRVELTDDEAHDFRVAEYIATHRGSTEPASLMNPELAAAAGTVLTAEQLRHPWYVRVDKGGRVAEIYLDAAGREPAWEPGPKAVLKTLHFLPALAAGKPIDSILPVRLDGRTTP